MKIRVAFTVDIDRKAWTDSYGDMEIGEVVRDVRTYVEDNVVSGLRDMGLWKETPALTNR